MSTLFSGHCLRNRSTLDIGVLGYIGIVQHKEHSPEVLSIPPGTPCIQWCITPEHPVLHVVCICTFPLIHSSLKLLFLHSCLKTTTLEWLEPEMYKKLREACAGREVPRYVYFNKGLWGSKLCTFYCSCFTLCSDLQITYWFRWLDLPVTALRESCSFLYH